MEKRLRSVFTLRSLETNEAVDALKNSLKDESVLLAHEVAYIMVFFISNRFTTKGANAKFVRRSFLG